MVNRVLGVAILALWVSCAAIATEASAPDAAPELTNSSHYVTMRDGVRIAVDLWIPAEPAPASLPAVLMLQRYWRARARDSMDVQDDSNYRLARAFADAGYALAIADVRGTGASFGSRPSEFSFEEVDDFRDIIGWLAAQPWSSGRVATTGSSYLGNTAELAAIGAPVALRAAVPRFNDFDTYRHAVFPGGVPNTVLLRDWGRIVAALDANDACALVGPDCDPQGPQGMGVKPVQGEEARLADAVSAHAANLDVTTVTSAITYIDDSFSRDGDPEVTLSAISPSRRAHEIDAARVPMLFWASWFDAGTADGALSRFMTYDTPMTLVIGAWNHGGSLDADPYLSEPRPATDPSVPAQYQQIFQFLDTHVKGDTKPPAKREIRYYTLGVNEWRSASQWPPAGVAMRSLRLGRDGVLSAAPAVGERGTDTHSVDFTTTTGTQNRWHTQIGTPVSYGDRARADRQLLTYTTGPLSAPLELTGHPLLELWLESTREDGAVHAYLEDVAPDGRVTYLTEGLFRLQHRALSTAAPDFHHFGPVHSFARQDAKPMPAGVAELVTFRLLPVSVVLRAGHRLRLAIAGADADSFARIPADGDAPVYRIHWGGSLPSRISLPIVGRDDLP